LGGYIEDSALIPVPNSNLMLVKNIDIFTPIVDEPNIMGQIAACNVVNDVFAMNVPEISGMLVFLAIQTKTPLEVAEGLLEGIKFFMEKKVNSKVLGGHTIYCDWPLIGGEASGFVEKWKIIQKHGIKAGDKLILTKPIGLQAVMAAYRLLTEMPEMLEEFSRSELQASIDFAIELMTTPNQKVVKAIHSYEDFSFIHSMSDVTGFGLAGHAKEMLQNSELSIILEKIPYIKLSDELSEMLGYAFDECRCHETAGGMLMAVAPDKVEDFVNRLKSMNISNWIVGEVDKRTPKQVRVSENAELVEVINI